MRHRLPTILAAGLLAVLPACGGEDESATAAPREGVVNVGMENIQFVPREVTVPTGETVLWSNTDQVPHNVTKESGPGEDFRSPNLNPGETFEHTFEEPGRIEYVCTIHPGQRGTVIVE